jgi:beta-aspartyl-dipeptidase (metallo-type)
MNVAVLGCGPPAISFFMAVGSEGAVPAVDSFISVLCDGNVLSPQSLGRKDLLLAGGVIADISDRINPCPQIRIERYDMKGCYIVPGFIDAHVHLIGAGGEGGVTSRTPELVLSQAIRAGVTTVVGCLGVDGTSRHLSTLLAKARALDEEGITSYIYTGAYQVPPPTITGSVRDDLILVDKVIGCGEIAISDHRSSQPTKQELQKLAADARVGGILSGKAGVLHLHLGDGERRLGMVFEIVQETEIPISQITPTHLNRNRALLDEGIRFAKAGGMIDLTTSLEPSVHNGQPIRSTEAVQYCVAAGVPIENMTLSSDGNGSLPAFDDAGELRCLRVAGIVSLHGAFKQAVGEGLPLCDALKLVTSNPARALRLQPRKGLLAVGSDADIIVLDDRLDVQYVFAKGRCLMDRGRLRAHGAFEREA